MQRHAAEQLHIEVTHAEHAPGRLATDREGLGEHGIKRLALREAGAQLGRPGGELLIGQPGEGGFERIDLRDHLAIVLQQTLVAAPENPGEKVLDHECPGRQADPHQG